jgi:hypothetical protein
MYNPSMCNGVLIGYPTQRVRLSNAIASTSDVRAGPETVEIGAIRDHFNEGISFTSSRASVACCALMRSPAWQRIGLAIGVDRKRLAD